MSALFDSELLRQNCDGQPQCKHTIYGPYGLRHFSESCPDDGFMFSSCMSGLRKCAFRADMQQLGGWTDGVITLSFRVSFWGLVLTV